MQRELVMLAQTFDPFKHTVEGSYLSEKLDGMRALWVPQTRGKLTSQVGWANTLKDKKPVEATGLWSRLGKVIHAPKWFLNDLPNINLDGELYNRWGLEKTLSVAKRKNPGVEWGELRYMVFDSPDNVDLTGKLPWVNYLGVDQYSSTTFEQRLRLLERLEVGYYWEVVEQTQLSFSRAMALEEIERRLSEVLKDGGEGVMLRRPHSMWLPKRSHELVKVKASLTGEGEILGFNPGKGKLAGLIGSIQVRWNGIVFDLSGFTDLEREPGNFKIGDPIQFTYRVLTPAGVPREGRYLR